MEMEMEVGIGIERLAWCPLTKRLPSLGRPRCSKQHGNLFQLAPSSCPSLSAAIAVASTWSRRCLTTVARRNVDSVLKRIRWNSLEAKNAIA